MRKLIYILVILTIANILIGANYPDFKSIVQRQHEIRAQEKEYYAQYWPEFTENTREMDNYDVLYYFIDIDIDFENEYIEASNLMQFEILEDGTTEIDVHFTDDLTADGATVNLITTSYTHINGIINIDLMGTYNAGDMLEVEIFYSGNPVARLEDGIKFEEHAGVPVVFSMVSPRGARKWWPCKDTPADKPDSLDIWITYPSQYICASNGLLQEEINNGNGTKTSRWHESYPVATYLTSFAITNYQIHSFLWEYNTEQMMVDNYYYPEQAASSIALYDQCEDMLTFLSDTYGIFPFLTEKYGHATCTNLGALAMEHQTCTSFDAGYISDPAAEYTVAHELGHSWAGDCLSIGSWSHVWLKEGFASYSEALWAEHLYGSSGLQDYMQAEDTGSVLDECLYRDDTQGANHIFNSVVYNKGSWTVHMLRGILGDEDFFALMQYYFQNPDLIYGNVLTEDLKNCAEDVAGYDMDWFFDEWFWNYGRPRYNYCYYTSSEEDSVKITLFSEGSQSDPFNMYVPFNIDDEQYRIWAADGYNYNTFEIVGAIAEIDWDPDNWVLDGGYVEKIPTLDEVSGSRDGSTVLTWEEFFDPEIEGFNIYRKLVGEDYIQLNATPVSGTFYFDEDVTAGQQYYYKISAVFDSEENYTSKFSNEISLIPVDFTFDQGILLVDGTQDYSASSPFPSDEDMDDFYSEILNGYNITSWDVAADGMPPLTEYAKYSTIIWHTDDIVNFPLDDDFYNAKSYLLAGGNLLISAWKLLYDIQENFSEYYLHYNSSYTNDQSDFAGAFGLNGFPDIAVDLDKIPLAFWGDNLQYVNKFIPADGAEAIYGFDSAINDPDWENTICAQRFFGDYKVYVFGFPLYYMEQSSIDQIIDMIMADFGEMSVADETLLPIQISLTNYPNPFNPTTTISFEINTESTKGTELIIYNLKGQNVKSFNCFPECNGVQGDTSNSVVWDGKDDNGKPVSSGIYFAKLNTNNQTVSKKMLLMK